FPARPSSAERANHARPQRFDLVALIVEQAADPADLEFLAERRLLDRDAAERAARRADRNSARGVQRRLRPAQEPADQAVVLEAEAQAVIVDEIHGPLPAFVIVAG